MEIQEGFPDQLGGVGEMDRAMLTEERLNQSILAKEREERAIFDEMMVLSRKRSELYNARGAAVSGIGPIVREIEQGRADVAVQLAATASVTGSVGETIRELDSIQRKVGSVLDRIDIMLGVRRCLDGVRSSLQAQSYETAVRCLGEYLKYDSMDTTRASVCDQDSGAEARGETGGPPSSDTSGVIVRGDDHLLVEAAQNELRSVVQKRFIETLEESLQLKRTSAESGGPGDRIFPFEKYLRLLKPLGLESFGLKRFCTFVGQVIAAQDTDVSPHPNFVAKITTIFESGVHAFEDYASLTIEAFGTEGIGAFLDTIQSTVDDRASPLIPRFMEDRGINKKVKLAKNLAPTAPLKDKKVPSSVPENNHTPRIDARDLDVVLQEMSVLAHRCYLFWIFIVEESENNRKLASQGTAVEKQVESVRLDREVRSLLSAYVVLEEFFLKESVKKAIQLDQDQGDASSVVLSSMVEDVFYLFQKCTYRGIFCRCVEAVCAVMGFVAMHVTDTMSAVFQRQLSSALSGASANLRAPVQAAPISRSINNLFNSIQHLSKLRSQVESGIKQGFSSTQKSDIDKCSSCLSDFVAAGAHLRKILESALDQLESVLRSRVRGSLDGFSTLNYNLNEMEYVGLGEMNEFWSIFLADVDAAFLPFKSTLLEGNFDALLTLFVRQVISQLERGIYQKPFSQLGGLQFDKDLRLLMTYFTRLSGRSVRGLFTRLSQSSQLLILQRAADALDYFVGDVSSWKLSPQDARSILRLRVDFQPETIAKLQF